jgi:succinoglycan biosynthesis transport protein ExoP
MAYDIAIPEDDSGGSFGDYLLALKRRRTSAIVIALSIIVVGTVITVLLPNSYKSTATILIESAEVPAALVQTTVTTFAAQQLQYISQRVMTRTNLAGIIEKFDLYADERKRLPTLMLVDEAEENMSIDLVDVQTADTSGNIVSSTIAFTLSFKHETPKTAQAVANELVSLYLDENVRTRTIQTAETSEFVQNEVDLLDVEVRKIEAEVADYKRENESSLPELSEMNLSLMQRIDSEILEIQRQIVGLVETRAIIETQMALVDPVGSRFLADGSTVVSPAEQLKGLQTQLAMLEGRYSADHPDVQALRRQIASLQEQLGVENIDLVDNTKALRDARAELDVARQDYSPDHPEVERLERVVESLEARQAEALTPVSDDSIEPDNPIYLDLKLKLDTLDADEHSLKFRAEQLENRLAKYEKNLTRTASVEQDLRAMERRLQTSTQQYLAAREKLFSAKMGQSLETQSKGERFVLVEPADQPLIPSSPNRPVLLGLFLVLGLSAGLGWPQLSAAIDGVITGGKSIQRVFGAPPIAEIPLIVTAADLDKIRNRRLLFFIAVPILFVVVLAVFHFVVMPLDVFWYVALRRLGF